MDQKQAQKVLTEILLTGTSDTAYMRLVEQARQSKQSVEKVAQRVASNIVKSLVTHKPSGYVDFPF